MSEEMELQALSLEQADMLDALGVEGCAHSARYVKERNPRLYYAILLALEWGVPKLEISERLKGEDGKGVSRNLIRAIEEAETASLEQGKRKLITVVRRFAHAAWGRLLEEVDEMKLEALMIAAGISTEKLLLLEGQATQIIEHKAGPNVGSVLEAIEARKRELLEASAIDVTPSEPVRRGESAGQMGGGPVLVGECVEETAGLVVGDHPEQTST